MVYFMQRMPMHIAHNYKMFLSYREGDMKNITIFAVVFTVKSTATFRHLSTVLTTKESSLHSEAHFCSNYSIIEGKKTLHLLPSSVVSLSSCSFTTQ